MHVFFWVTHLLGVGHFHRAVRIARALRTEGVEVTIVNGGLPLENVRLGDFEIRDIPPVRSPDTSYKRLIDGDGHEVTDAYFAQRTEALLRIAAEIRPTGILTELYPYGRWKFRKELIPLIEAMLARSPRPAIVASIRDIIVPPRRADRIDGIRRIVADQFDRLLVHGDPDFIRIEDTLPLAAEFEAITDYTGYVLPDHAKGTGEGEGSGEVVVSAGGSAFGGHLLATAIRTKPATRFADRIWRILVGQRLPEADFRELATLAGDDPGIIVERARADFPELLTRARLSISQAGYNTTGDVMAARVPAVFAPMAEADQSEQILRVKLLAARGLAVTLMENPLTTEGLGRAVDAAADIEMDETRLPRAGGAGETARRLKQIMSEMGHS